MSAPEASFDPARLAERARAWTLDLVRQPSVTNSPGEAAFGPWLRDRLLALPAFAGREGQVRLERTLDDARERSVVYALARGSGRRTLVLTGHYDVVGVANYGTLRDLAFDPEALLPALVEELRSHGRGAADALALQDLEGGGFLPGRAALDMKSGLAAGLAVLEAFAESGGAGNVLFVAVPDEEEASHGMRSAVRQLPALAREWNLDLVGAVNLDAEVDPDDGDAGRAVFLGSVGKLLPSVLLVGRPTHAGAPFDGVSAVLMTAELLRRVELGPDLIDPGVEGEPGPPPVALGLYDLKPHYDVTTPEMVWVTFNVLLRANTPRDVLAAVLNATRGALDAALSASRERAAVFATRSGKSAPALDVVPDVLTAAELWARVRERGGPDAEARLAALSRELAADTTLDAPRVCQRLTEAAARLAGLEGPAAVVGFGSLYYPAAALGPDPRARALLAAVRAATDAVRDETGERVRLRPFFPGVSDMSFLGPCDDPEGVAVVTANTPAWGTRLNFDYAAAVESALPVVNIGPWGRDYHQRTERVHAPYAFGTLPRLLWHTLHSALEDQGGLQES